MIEEKIIKKYGKQIYIYNENYYNCYLVDKKPGFVKVIWCTPCDKIGQAKWCKIYEKANQKFINTRGSTINLEQFLPISHVLKEFLKLGYHLDNRNTNEVYNSLFKGA